MPDELIYLWSRFSNRSLIDGISLEGMDKRFMEFEKLLPKFENLTAEQMELARESIQAH